MVGEHAGTDEEVVVVGAGPAGLTAAVELVRRGAAVTVIEGDAVVGGISRTACRDGWRFDIGGHRFFTKVPRVQALWHDLLGEEDFVVRPRTSRILYRGKLYDYPLSATNALRNLGLVEAVRCMASYAWVRVRPPADRSTFEGWVAARFGWRLYEHFFRHYTHKLWGVPGAELEADWAAQRIQNLSLLSAVRHALGPRRPRRHITSLIEEFHYPRLGPGMMWEAAADRVVAGGGELVMEEKVTAVHWEHGRGATGVTTVVTGGYGPGAGSPPASRTDVGAVRHRAADRVISSMPYSSLLRAMDPAPPREVLEAADGLRYRDFLTVALVVPSEAGFPDNWIYVHDPDVEVGRIQNFGAWSPDLVRDGLTCLGLELFVTVGDATWERPDADLVAQAERELDHLGLVPAGQVREGFVVRMPKAYPFYDADYRRRVATMRAWMEEHARNVHPVGRNGMFRYNNQDHSMLTAMLTVDNICDGAGHDVWDVNVAEDYHEHTGPPPERSAAPPASVRLPDDRPAHVVASSAR